MDDWNTWNCIRNWRLNGRILEKLGGINIAYWQNDGRERVKLCWQHTCDRIIWRTSNAMGLPAAVAAAGTGGLGSTLWPMKNTVPWSRRNCAGKSVNGLAGRTKRWTIRYGCGRMDAVRICKTICSAISNGKRGKASSQTSATPIPVCSCLLKICSCFFHLFSFRGVNSCFYTELPRVYLLPCLLSH